MPSRKVRSMRAIVVNGSSDTSEPLPMPRFSISDIAFGLLKEPFFEAGASDEVAPIEIPAEPFAVATGDEEPSGFSETETLNLLASKGNESLSHKELFFGEL